MFRQRDVKYRFFREFFNLTIYKASNILSFMGKDYCELIIVEIEPTMMA